MAVHIISKKAVNKYIETNPRYGPSLRAWTALVEKETWTSPQDIKASFGAGADILGKKDNKPTTLPAERAIVDVRGNAIRVIFKYSFHPTLKISRIYIKWIGTHAEYTKLCAKKQQYDVDDFK